MAIAFSLDASAGAGAKVAAAQKSVRTIFQRFLQSHLKKNKSRRFI
jgi:hypothetical protein